MKSVNKLPQAMFEWVSSEAASRRNNGMQWDGSGCGSSTSSG